MPHTNIDCVGPDIRRAIESALYAIPSRANRAAENCYLGGDYDPRDAYRSYQNYLSRLIGTLKMMHRELGEVAGHQHEWDDNDYCVVCGSDGRA